MGTSLLGVCSEGIVPWVMNCSGGTAHFGVPGVPFPGYELPMVKFGYELPHGDLWSSWSRSCCWNERNAPSCGCGDSPCPSRSSGNCDGNGAVAVCTLVQVGHQKQIKNKENKDPPKLALYFQPTPTPRSMSVSFIVFELPAPKHF